MSLPIIRVLVADDHPIVREGIVAVLEKSSWIRVVDTADSFDQTYTYMVQHKPHVLILDIRGMGGSPLIFMEKITRSFPDVRTIIFSSSVDFAPELIQAGAKGYIVKDDLSSQLTTAIQHVAAGGTFISPEAQVYLDRAHAHGRDIPLTDRELSVLKCLSLGLTTQAIGDELCIDPRTVQNYINKLRAKIGCDERVQLADWYRRVYSDIEICA